MGLAADAGRRQSRQAACLLRGLHRQAGARAMRRPACRSRGARHDAVVAADRAGLSRACLQNADLRGRHRSQGQSSGGEHRHAQERRHGRTCCRTAHRHRLASRHAAGRVARPRRYRLRPRAGAGDRGQRQPRRARPGAVNHSPGRCAARSLFCWKLRYFIAVDDGCPQALDIKKHGRNYANRRFLAFGGCALSIGCR